MIETFPYAEGFNETILPHEMGHIIFRELVGSDNPIVPLWLEEGVASYQERDKYSASRSVVREAIGLGEFMDIDELSRFSVSAENNKRVNIFYAESICIVEYLIKEFGQDRFVLFCQNLRDKGGLDRAVSATYPFNNIKELDAAWQEYLKK
jgi:hypothetical protein